MVARKILIVHNFFWTEHMVERFQFANQADVEISLKQFESDDSHSRKQDPRFDFPNYINLS